MILYHGSNVNIDNIDLTRCHPNKDFGKGFYTTEIKEQAWNMARRTASIYGGNPCMNIFSIDDGVFNISCLRMRVFDKPDKEWAIFVINNRNRYFSDINSSEGNIDNKYDIVMGPVANDNLRDVFEIYNRGIVPIEYLVSLLEYKKLISQISFHTAASIQYLKKQDVIQDVIYGCVQQHLIVSVQRDVITFIVEDTGVEIELAMEQFYTSEVFEKLQNIETGLYSESPAYVYHLYKIECQYGKLVQLEV